MLVEIILPMVTIFGTGLTLFSILQRLFRVSTIHPLETFLFSLLIGTGIIIIPMAFFGLQNNTFFFKSWPVLLALIGSIGSFTLFYLRFKYILANLETISDRIKFTFVKSYKNQHLSTQLLLFSLICFLIIDYILYQLFLPIRGYDALWAYIPESLWYWRTNHIPVLNLLNFRPSSKEPAHILLFSYSLYTTGELSIQFLPILFLLGWVAIIYLFTIRMWQNQIKALFAVLLFLVTPFMNWLVNFWAYYQDIYLAFYFSAALYCVFAITQFDESHKKAIFYTFLGGLSVCLALLSKLSGWVLLLVILLVIPFKNRQRIIPSVLVLTIGFFLFLRAISTVYWGLGIVILGYMLLIIIILWRSNPHIYE